MAERRFAWVFNLDAELELANPGYQPSSQIAAQLARYAPLARDLLGPGDVVLCERGGASVPPGSVGRAWCPTPSAIRRLSEAGAHSEPHPELAVLRRVNHRRFAFELGGGLAQQAYVETRDELERVLSAESRAWLLKRPFSFAGRGQLRLYRTPTRVEWSWVEASLRSDGLILEPLIEPSLELSLHGFVEQGGTYELGRPCVQQVSERGVFRRARLAARAELSASEIRALFVHADRAARALAGAGYFGPFGIDAYRYRDGARAGFCALGELNARYTMAFAVGFPRPTPELVQRWSPGT